LKREYNFKARVNKFDNGNVNLDPVQASVEGMTFSKGSRLQRTLKLKNNEIVNIIIKR